MTFIPVIIHKTSKSIPKKHELLVVLSHSCLTKTLAIYTDLMKIKRKEIEKKRLPGEKERKSEALISRQAAGMCFDFHPKVGSECPSWLKQYLGKPHRRGEILSWSYFNMH